MSVAAGERLTERRALQALLLPSANNIAAVLARWDAGPADRFVARMNSTARSLGMTHTRYTDPSGYDDATVSTAADAMVDRIAGHRAMPRLQQRTLPLRTAPRSHRLRLHARAFLEPSDGLEPSTPSLPCAPEPLPWVATGCRSACLSGFRGCPICHRLPPVAPAGLFLKKGRGSNRCLVDGTSFVAPGRLGAHLFLGVGVHTVSVGAVSASQFHKGPSGGQSKAGACRDRGGAWRGVEGFVAGEHVPGGDQDLARDGGLGGVFVV